MDGHLLFQSYRRISSDWNSNRIQDWYSLDVQFCNLYKLTETDLSLTLYLYSAKAFGTRAISPGNIAKPVGTSTGNLKHWWNYPIIIEENYIFKRHFTRLPGTFRGRQTFATCNVAFLCTFCIIRMSDSMRSKAWMISEAVIQKAWLLPPAWIFHTMPLIILPFTK